MMDASYCLTCWIIFLCRVFPKTRKHFPFDWVWLSSFSNSKESQHDKHISESKRLSEKRQQQKTQFQFNNKTYALAIRKYLNLIKQNQFGLGITYNRRIDVIFGNES